MKKYLLILMSAMYLVVFAGFAMHSSDDPAVLGMYSLK